MKQYCITTFNQLVPSLSLKKSTNNCESKIESNVTQYDALYGFHRSQVMVIELQTFFIAQFYCFAFVFFYGFLNCLFSNYDSVLCE